MADHREFERFALPILSEYATYRLSGKILDTSGFAERLVELFRQSRMEPEAFVAAFYGVLDVLEGEPNEAYQLQEHDLHDISSEMNSFVSEVEASVIPQRTAFWDGEALVNGLDD